MLHIKDNIKIVRALLKESQDDFRQRFTGVSLSMQKSYEQGAANPGVLYIAEIAELAGVSEKDIRNKKLSKEDIKLRGPNTGKDQKDNKDENAIRGTSVDQNDTSKSPTSDNSLEKLIACNEHLSRAALIQAEADKIREEKELALVQNNTNLTEILKQRESTGNAESENPLAHPYVQMKLLETLAELGAGTLWKTKEDGLILLGNRFAVPDGEAKNRESTRVGEGRKSIA